MLAFPVCLHHVSTVWLGLWVRCGVYPLLVRLFICPLPLSLLTFHLCAVGCKWSRKRRRTLTNELLPDCSHVRPHHSWFGPPQTYAGRTVRGVGNRLGIGEGKRGHPSSGPWPWDQGPEACPENSLSEKIAGEVSRSIASGGVSFSFPFIVCMVAFDHTVLHTAFMWQLAHIIWLRRKCGLRRQEHTSLCSANAIHWCQEISNWPRWGERKKKSFEDKNLHLWARRCVVKEKASRDIVFSYWAVLLSLIHGAENRQECDSTTLLKDRVRCPNTRGLRACFHDSRGNYSRCFIWNECVNYKPTWEIIYRLIL